MNKTVYLTKSEMKQYEHFVERIEISRTAAEAKIFQRRIRALIEKGKERGKLYERVGTSLLCKNW